MNEILEQSLLYDFYGELLSERQKEVYEQSVFEDLSLGEIARETGLSRQGVHDLVKRSRQLLEEYEKKLHLVEKFLSIKNKVEEIDNLLDEHIEKDTNEHIEESDKLLWQIRQIADKIIEEL